MRYAVRGILKTLETERHMRIHLAFTFYVILAGFVCQIELWQWCAVLICIGIVSSLEILNTAVERTCDSVTMERNENIKIAKDAAAGAVLVSAISSAIVGTLIFINPENIAKTIEFTLKYPILAIVIVLTLPFWIKYIFMRRPKNVEHN